MLYLLPKALYPFSSFQNGECHFNRKNVGATLTGCVDIPHENEMALKVAVAKVGPISVAIDAGHQSFQLYESGTLGGKEKLYFLPFSNP